MVCSGRRTYPIENRSIPYKQTVIFSQIPNKTTSTDTCDKFVGKPSDDTPDPCTPFHQQLEERAFAPVLLDLTPKTPRTQDIESGNITPLFLQQDQAGVGSVQGTKENTAQVSAKLQGVDMVTTNLAFPSFQEGMLQRGQTRCCQGSRTPTGHTNKTNIRC